MHPVLGFVVARLVVLVLGVVSASLVLPALYANHRMFRGNSADDSLFLHVVAMDWVFAFTGIGYNIVQLAVNLEEPVLPLWIVLYDGVFHTTFVATVLWSSVLAYFVLRNGDPTFRVAASCGLVWTISGSSGLLRTFALEASNSKIDAGNPTGLSDAASYVYGVILTVSCLLVVSAAVTAYCRKHQLLGCTGEPFALESLLRHVLILSLVRMPLLISLWLTGEDHLLHDVAFTLSCMEPILNAYELGRLPVLHRYQKRDRPLDITITATCTTIPHQNHRYPPSMDSNIELEELDDLGSVRFLAEGASGSVYRARWLGINVAMKVLKLPTDAKKGQASALYQTIIQHSEQAFLEEASICARLRHPNITLFLRAGRYDGKLGILTEFCERGSLKDVLKLHFPLNWKRKVSLALDVAKGLTYLHARNPTYIHRDLKSSNILVTDSWQAKLADFGISRVSTIARERAESVATQPVAPLSVVHEDNFLTESTSFAGTWRWNAPEILKDPANCHYSAATDMYSFGMVLWEILSDGAVPFGSVRFDFEVRNQVIAEFRPPIRLSMGCPDGFTQLIEQCWAQEPRDRPSADQVADELVKILSQVNKKRTFFIPDIIASSVESRDNLFSPMSRSERARSSLGMRLSSFFGRGSDAAQPAFLPTPKFSRTASDDDKPVSQKTEHPQFVLLVSPKPRDVEEEPVIAQSVALGSRRRGFTKENALPALDESVTMLSSPVESVMAPIFELPVDAMLEDSRCDMLSEDGKSDVDSDSEESFRHNRRIAEIV
ncbi:hypothetical protein Poli38472_002862 [Pythium oligandrum]|uniref:Protein kinase domain-containing protein n=1 Tax=Pythium oligandrum TaxID=41045 RepID=A0A8K1C6H6_PYTOL|nr:hypothetical protein Poli38472_002862 [Pythium oligandrum]|eukprot:TMW56937.1 hypothetical protein Poli38472_002862 [Pythium oligandrum]